MILDTLGWAFMKVGDYRAAEVVLRRALSANPNLAEAKEHLSKTQALAVSIGR